MNKIDEIIERLARMEAKCKNCAIAEQVMKHEKTLYGDATDIDGNPGLVGYLRELRPTIKSMNFAIWVIAAVLVLLLFGFSPKDIIEKIVVKAIGG